MTASGELLGLLGEHPAGKHLQALMCAQDVADALLESISHGEPVDRAVLQDGALVSLLGTSVQAYRHYAPGRWKLVRHDRCEVIGGGDIDKSMIVTHRECTVLGESSGSS